MIVSTVTMGLDWITNCTQKKSELWENHQTGEAARRLFNRSTAHVSSCDPAVAYPAQASIFHWKCVVCGKTLSAKHLWCGEKGCIVLDLHPAMRLAASGDQMNKNWLACASVSDTLALHLHRSAYEFTLHWSLHRLKTCSNSVFHRMRLLQLANPGHPLLRNGGWISAAIRCRRWISAHVSLAQGPNPLDESTLGPWDRCDPWQDTSTQ